MLYDSEHISGSPYTINVFDPSMVKVYGLEGGTVGSGMTFNGNLTFLFFNCKLTMSVNTTLNEKCSLIYVSLTLY